MPVRELLSVTWQSVLHAVQVGVFSATLPPEALEITRKFMNKPVRTLVCSSRSRMHCHCPLHPTSRHTVSCMDAPACNACMHFLHSRVLHAATAACA